METRELDVRLIRMGAQIKRIRLGLDMAAETFSAATSIDRHRLLQIEQGNADPTYLELLAISAAFDYDLHDLVNFDLLI